MQKGMELVNILLNKKAEKNPLAYAPKGNPASIDTTKWANYTGRYFRQHKPGHSSHIPKISFYDIKHEGDSLNFYYTSNAYFTMLPIGENLFKDPEFSAVIQISRPHADSAMRMQIWPSDGSLMNFKKVENPVHPSRDYLQQFTGEYRSPHLDFYCRIVLTEQNELVIRRSTISDKILIPDGENRFLFEMEADNDSWYVVAQFTKNAKGEVDGITMQHVRMMHHRFDKVR